MALGVYGVALLIVFGVGLVSLIPPTQKAVWVKQGVALPPATFSANATDYYGTAHPSIVRLANGTYLMWYAGYMADEPSGYGSLVGQIHLATSSDGVTWEKGGVVLPRLTAPWYFGDLRSPTVLWDGTSYEMWFTAYESAPWPDPSMPDWYWANTTPRQVYHATSANGVNWSVGGVAMGPVAAGSWLPDLYWSVSVVRVDRAFRMYYTEYDVADPENGTLGIGLATSANGTSFTPLGSGPVFRPDPASPWECGYVFEPRVFGGPPWTLYYTGAGECSPQGDTAVGLGAATSEDGINWTRSPGNPLLGPGHGTSSIDCDGVGAAVPMTSPSGDRLYYTGQCIPLGASTPQAWWRIGVATPGNLTLRILALDPLVSAAFLVGPPALGLATYVGLRRSRAAAKRAHDQLADAVNADNSVRREPP